MSPTRKSAAMPARAASARARSTACGERSTPVTRCPRRASSSAWRPSPHGKSNSRPGPTSPSARSTRSTSSRAASGGTTARQNSMAIGEKNVSYHSRRMGCLVTRVGCTTRRPRVRWTRPGSDGFRLVLTRGGGPARGQSRTGRGNPRSRPAGAAGVVLTPCLGEPAGRCNSGRVLHSASGSPHVPEERARTCHRTVRRGP